MGGEWTRVRLADLCEFRAGSVFKPEYQGQNAGAYPFVKVSDMNLPENSVRIQAANNWVSESDIRALKAKPLPQGTVVFAKIGEALRQNRLRQVVRDTVVDNNMMGAIPRRERVDPAFFYYALAQFNFADIAHGTALPYLTVASLSTLELACPPLAEQRAIARILGALDDKIELNRKTNATLEAMARALFKSWFVDFDPVRAKAEGRDPSGMDAETAKLFPSELVESELGLIPKGWRHVQVKEVCAGLFDGPHATPPEADSGAVFLGIRNFAPTRLDFADIRYISDADYPAWTKRVVPQAGDIVFTYEATLGFFALIPPGLRCCLGRRTALVRPRSEVQDSHYLFEWFVARPFQDFLRAHRQPGSTVDRIWLKDFPSYPVLQAPSDLVRRFEIAATPNWARIHANQFESATLAKLRDELLPRLLSGELSVARAERAVGEVA